MDPSELLNYKEQVAALETALLSDPNNEELLTLKTELLDLISLTETLLQQEQQLAAPSSVESTPVAFIPVPAVAVASATSSPYRTAESSGSGASTPTTPTTSTATTTQPRTTATTNSSSASNQPIYQPPPPTRHWAVGDRCKALYAEDGKFYEATILGVGAGGQVYSVQYKGYADSPPVTLGPENLKPIYDHKKHQAKQEPGAGAGAGAGAGEVEDGAKAGQKRGPDGAAGGAGGAGGMKKKKQANAGPSEQVQKQMAWQNFAKGGAKKAKSGSGLLKKSIFATPDNPEGKVGVVGSGKGMTQFQQRGKHLYGNAPE